MGTIIKKNALSYGMKGNVGNLSLYQKNGQTMVSVKNDEPRTNNSYAQLSNTIVWSNLVQNFKSLKTFCKKCFQFKIGHQSDYNIFMKQNLKYGEKVYLTKEEAEQKYCILAPLKISQGELPAIVITETNSQYQTDIKVNSVINSATTIGMLSMDIVDHNTEYDYGDKISYLEMTQKVAEGVPYVRVGWATLELNKTNQAKVWDLLTPNGFNSVNGYLGKTSLTDGHGFTYVHGRDEDDEVRYVSTQTLIVKNTILTNYTSEEAKLAALLSYNVQDEVIVIPNAEGTSSSGGYFDEEETTTTVTITAKVASGQDAMGTVQAGSSAAGATSSVTVAKNTSVQLKAVANTGYHFKQWNDGSTQATISVVADATATYTATFEADTPTGNVTVTLTSENVSKGKVQINGGEQGATATATVTSGSSVTIKAISVAGYDFLKWSDNNQNYERTLTPTENVSLTAYFEEE